MADTIDNEIAYDEQAQAFDANDPDAIEAAEKNIARKKARMLNFVAFVMSNEDGREWMFDLLGDDCHTFAENTMRGTDGQIGKFEGERGVGLRLVSKIMAAAPEMFWKMWFEALERNRNAPAQSA